MAPGELQAYFHAEQQAGLLAAGLGVAFDVFAEHRAHAYTRWVETIGA